MKDLKAYQRKEIEKSIANAASSGTEDLKLQEAALKSANVIDYLNRATDNEGNKLPKENLVSAVIVAAGAGFVTTSTLLSWLLYGLVSYPGMQERLLQELVDNGFSDDTEVTPELIEKLTFQESYIKEMQRVHNPSYQPGRTAKVDLILPGGYKIKKGDVIVGAIHHVHNNAQYWDNPAKFDPDRWSTDKVKNLPKTAYIPFATGPRMCVGFNFALQEIKIFLPKLVWRYAWAKEGEAAVEYDPFFQLVRPVNLYVRTTKRTSRPSKSDSFQS